jgi:hypothetical protein
MAEAGVPSVTGASAGGAGVVRVGVECLECGYNLRGLAVEGVCPECGQEVGVTLRHPFLRRSGKEAVGKVRRGMAMASGAVAGVAGLPLLGMLAPVVFVNASGGVFLVVLLALLLMLYLWGWFRVWQGLRAPLVDGEPVNWGRQSAVSTVALNAGLTGAAMVLTITVIAAAEVAESPPWNGLLGVALIVCPLVVGMHLLALPRTLGECVKRTARRRGGVANRAFAGVTYLLHGLCLPLALWAAGTVVLSMLGQYEYVMWAAAYLYTVPLHYLWAVYFFIHLLVMRGALNGEHAAAAAAEGQTRGDAPV